FAALTFLALALLAFLALLGLAALGFLTLAALALLGLGAGLRVLGFAGLAVLAFGALVLPGLAFLALGGLAFLRFLPFLVLGRLALQPELGAHALFLADQLADALEHALHAGALVLQFLVAVVALQEVDEGLDVLAEFLVLADQGFEVIHGQEGLVLLELVDEG